MSIKITYKQLPSLIPQKIETKSKGFFGGIILWVLTTRKWEVAEDWNFSIQMDGQKTTTQYMIPKGFISDGASIPKFLRNWVSVTGVLLSGGLIHDYGYKYATLRLATKKPTVISIKDQKWFDQLFRDINCDVNGFVILNYGAYYALRLGGWLAWNGHRKRNCKWDDGLK